MKLNVSDHDSPRRKTVRVGPDAILDLLCGSTNAPMSFDYRICFADSWKYLMWMMRRNWEGGDGE